MKAKTILAIDWGKRWLGVALAWQKVVVPLTTIDQQTNWQTALLKIIKDYQVSRIVVGLPQGKNKKLITQFAKKIKKMVKLPVELVDESFTTWEAEGLIGTKKKKAAQALAAAMILKRFVNS